MYLYGYQNKLIKIVIKNEYRKLKTKYTPQYLPVKESPKVQSFQSVFGVHCSD